MLKYTLEVHVPEQALGRIPQCCISMMTLYVVSQFLVVKVMHVLISLMWTEEAT